MEIPVDVVFPVMKDDVESKVFQELKVSLVNLETKVLKETVVSKDLKVCQFEVPVVLKDPLVLKDHPESVKTADQVNEDPQEFADQLVFQDLKVPWVPLDFVMLHNALVDDQHHRELKDHLLVAQSILKKLWRMNLWCKGDVVPSNKLKSEIIQVTIRSDFSEPYFFSINFLLHVYLVVVVKIYFVCI